MYPASPAAQLLLAQSHTAVSYLDVLHSGMPAARLYAVDGLVNAEGGRSVTRNLQATVVDPTGALDGHAIDDLLSPYDCEVAPYRGVLLPDGSWEVAPLGVFQLTQRQVGDYGSLALAGQDRAIIYQGSMTNALAISGGTPVETAIQRLLATRNRSLTMHSWVTGFTCGPLLFAPDINVWDEAQTLAQSVGGRLSHDRTGALVFGPDLPISDRPVRTYIYGGGGSGVLLDATRTEDADTIHNSVTVVSTKTGTGGITYTARDADPTSPTYVGNPRYGERNTTIENQHVGSLVQAQQAATAALIRELGRSETGTVTAVVDPFLDPNDVVLVDHPAKGYVQRAMVLAAVPTPLGVGESMALALRKSIIGQDGVVLDNAVLI